MLSSACCLFCLSACFLMHSGDLGCFSLTEKFAGVNSGLVVNTTATFDVASGCFTLNTPDEGGKKNWISQGFVADKTCVSCSLASSPYLTTTAAAAADVAPSSHWIFLSVRRVVVADLLLEGKSYGPHAFLMDLRVQQDGALVAGVTVGDMGSKTVGNDLDNAWVSSVHWQRTTGGAAACLPHGPRPAHG